MATYFNDSTYLQTNTPLDFQSTGTFFVRVNPTFTIADSLDHLFLIYDDAAHFAFLAKDLSNNVVFTIYDGALKPLTGVATDYLTQDVFSSHLGTWDTGAPNREYYIDNVLVASSAIAFSVPSPLVRFRIGNNSFVAGGPAEAHICEYARWNRVLSAEERQVLQVTGCPLFVPNGIVEYLPIVRHGTGTGRNLVGTTSLTLTGALVSDLAVQVTRPDSGLALTLAALALSVDVPLISSTTTLYTPSLSYGLNIDVPLISSTITLHTPAVAITIEPPAEDARTLAASDGLDERITTFVAGDSLRISRTYQGLPEGAFISKAYLTIKRSRMDLDAEAIVQVQITASIGNYGLITDDSTLGGSVDLYFDLTTTQTEPLHVAHIYDITLITTGMIVYTAELGVIKLHRGITDATS